MESKKYTIQMDDIEEQQNRKKAIKSVMTRWFRRFLILVIVCAVVGTGVFVLWRVTSKRSESANPEMGIFTVIRDSLAITVVENGDIRAINSKDIKSEVEGRTNIISIVDEGTNITQEDVNNGKVLVELDSSDIEQKLTQQKVAFLSAEASYADANESLEIQQKQNESDIKAGLLKIRFASIDLHKYIGELVAEKLITEMMKPGFDLNEIASLVYDSKLEGEALQKLRELEDNITLDRSNLERSIDKLDGTKKLFEKDYVSETELKADQYEVESAQMKAKRSQTALKLFKLYEFPKEAEKRLSDYEEAQRELDRIEASARSKLIQSQAKLASSEATFLLHQDRLKKLQEQLEACTIKAPSPGQVVYSSSMDRWARMNNRMIEEGSEIHERQQIISIPDTSAMKVEIKVHETWIDKVQPDQQAKITVAAFPDETFTGKVLKKAPLADPEDWISPDHKVYTTDVSIEGTHDSLKTGMTAKVEIMIEELEEVIIVPVQTVVSREGKKFCYVLASQESEPREVETGGFNDNFVEIKSGLLEGEKVLLNPPRLTESELENKTATEESVS